MPRHFILKLAIVAVGAATCGTVWAQTKSEYLRLTNLGPAEAGVKVRGSTRDGEPTEWKGYKFGRGFRGQILLQEIGFEPFDVAITQADGSELTIYGITLCSMMQDCLNEGRTVQRMTVTKKAGGKERRKAVNVSVAEDTVEFDFGPGSVTEFR